MWCSSFYQNGAKIYMYSVHVTERTTHVLYSGNWWETMMAYVIVSVCTCTVYLGLSRDSLGNKWPPLLTGPLGVIGQGPLQLPLLVLAPWTWVFYYQLPTISLTWMCSRRPTPSRSSSINPFPASCGIVLVLGFCWYYYYFLRRAYVL